MRGRAYIGTSGYTYEHWGNGVFYPADLPQKGWLEYYARHFSSVELNVTFYRLPDRSVFRAWARRTPQRFAFVVKGSRYITHVKRLRECREPLGRFMRNAAGLGDKLRLVLWQLPPQMKADAERLAGFCALLARSAYARRLRHAFEFRHASWFDAGIYEALRAGNHALCIAHSPGWPMAQELTADFVYLRFHGGEQLYGSEYSDDELREWAAAAAEWMRRGRDVYAYFNNDARGFAVRNARRLRDLIRAAQGEKISPGS